MRPISYAIVATLSALVCSGFTVRADAPATTNSAPAEAPAVSIPSIAFQSDQNSLVPNDKNGWIDIFVKDGATGKMDRVSVTNDGAESNGPSAFPSITPDGRYVVFSSEATNLVPGDTNEMSDIFVFDRNTRKIDRISVASDGTEANQNSWHCSISDDGRYVAFESYATNLAPGSRGPGDVYVHDRQTHQTERVSISSEGVAADKYSRSPTLSADGRYVAFQSLATLAQGGTDRKCSYVYDRQTHKTEVFGIPGPYFGATPMISADGRYVAYQSCMDINVWQIFVYDRKTGKDQQLTIGTDKSPGNGPSQDAAISADGRYVAFQSTATNLVPDTKKGSSIFVCDTQTLKIDRIGDGVQASISPDGRFVVLVDKAQLFLFDRQTGTSSQIAGANSSYPVFSAGN